MPELTQVQNDAIKILDGIEEIARRDMLIRGTYITPVLNEELAAAGTICGGRQACMLGSMWIAAGFTVMEKGEMELPGVTTDKLPEEYKSCGSVYGRKEAAALKPDLDLAFHTMNEVCYDLGVEIYGSSWTGLGNAMEELFEATNGFGDPLLSDDDLFMLLERGREAIRSQVTA